MGRAWQAAKSLKRVRVSGTAAASELLRFMEPEAVEIQPKTKKPKTMMNESVDVHRSKALEKLRKLQQTGLKLNGLAGQDNMGPWNSRVSCRTDFETVPSTLAEADHLTADQDSAYRGAAFKGSGGGCASGGKGIREICAEGRRRKLERQREEARMKIASMTNTARFSDNLDSMDEFINLIEVACHVALEL